MTYKILIRGLPGAGKTTLADALQQAINDRGEAAAVFDGDTVRMADQNVDFSPEGRLAQASRLGELCNVVNREGCHGIASFVCPTMATFDDFYEGSTERPTKCFTIFVDRIVASPYADTNAIFSAMVPYDYSVQPEETVDYSVLNIMRKLFGYNNETATAMFIGRFQPFHAGHLAQVKLALVEFPQVWIGVRQMPDSPDNPHDVGDVIHNIREILSEYGNRVRVAPIPNIKAFLYGRDVGYEVREVRLPAAIEAVSATRIREGLQK